MKTLETKRLLLREWQPSDLEDFYNYCKHPDVGPEAGWSPHQSREESKKFLDLFIEKQESWAVVYKENNKVIGSVALNEDPKRDNQKARIIGYELAVDYWGQGLMPEAVDAALSYAFGEMDLDLVSACHFATNTRSKAVLLKAGFQFEGITRKAYTRYDGAVLDDYCYSILKEEFEK